MNNLQGNGHPHAYNQCYDYISNNNKIIVSDMIHFENIEHEFNEFCKKYSIITKLPHINSNPKKTFVNKSSLYTERMKEIVEKLFKDDIKHFGYSYERWLNVDFL